MYLSKTSRDGRGCRGPELGWLGGSVSADVAIRTLICILFLLTVGPGLLLKVLGGGRQQVIDQRASAPPLVAQLQFVLGLLVAALCAAIILGSVRHLGKISRGNPALFALLSLWSCLIVFDAVNGTAPTILSFLFPVVSIAVWAAQPAFRVITTVAYCGSVTATLSLALGIFFPVAGLYANSSGEFVSADKGILPGQLLSGVFTSTNNLGQFLVLCLPAALVVPRRIVRLAIFFVISAAVFWSGSRSSLAAAAIVLLAAAVPFSKSIAVKRIRLILLLSSMAACALLPFIVSHAPTALSGRGNLWRVSIAAWRESPVVGLGSKWFLETARMRSDFGARSAFTVFHGHNQLLHLLVTGGLISALLFCVSVRIIWRSAVASNACVLGVGGAFLSCFFVSGAMELNLGVVDRFQFYATSLMPLLVIAFAQVESGGFEDDM